MTITKVQALWLEDDDNIYINDETYRVLLVSPENNDMVTIHLTDDQGYRKTLVVPSSREIPVICDLDHFVDA